MRAPDDTVIDAAEDFAARRREEQRAINAEIGDESADGAGPDVLTLDEMVDRLVFVGKYGAVVDRVTGKLRTKATAPQEYAASKHRQELGGKKWKEVSAFAKWMESPLRKGVDGLSWQPGQPQFCQDLESEDTVFNTWRGLKPMAAPGNWQKRVKPFLRHVTFLIPEKAERKRHLQWLAHVVQYPEVLPHTSYLMIATTPGIGRNLYASIIVRALRGHAAAGVSLPDLLDGSFTGRLSKKLLAIVDEAREGSGDRRHQRSQRLKTLVTEEVRLINPKYGVQSVEKNCCRWLKFSNHLDAIPFDDNDRRTIVVANPKVPQSPEYYARLYGMVDDPDFIGSVRRWLETLDISKFNPGEHAPMNSTKKQALDVMRSSTERAVLHFKEDCETDLTYRDYITDYVINATTDKLNDSHLTHAIVRAGMNNTGHRVRIGSVKRSVVIVRGNYTPETVAKMAGDVIRGIIESKPAPKPAM